jgi:hypothetical protein
MKIKIIDNFFKDEDFKLIQKFNLKKKVQKNGIEVYHNKIDKNYNVEADIFDKETLKKLFKSYHSIAMNILEELSPEKKHLYEFSEFHIIEIGKDFIFPIHDDTPNKLLSGVIYLKPDNNFGTIFYKNKKGEDKKIIEWKVNRAVFFSRLERSSWHSYRGDGISNRITIVYNLMTNDIKSVLKIENKNYFFSLLRYKINPYLFKYFKFTI